MKKAILVLTHILTAMLATLVTLTLTMRPAAPAAETSKLDELQNLIEQCFIGEVDSVAIEDAAADAMVNALGDRWSYYIPASEYGAYQEQMKNAYVGIGITVQLMEDQKGVLVTQVNPNGPAYEVGILAGDVIVGVENTDVCQMTLDEVSALIKGEAGTKVTLTVLRGETRMDIPVERRTVLVTVATGKMLEGNTGLITITNFDSRCAQETIVIIDSLLEQGASSLIFWTICCRKATCSVLWIMPGMRR